MISQLEPADPNPHRKWPWCIVRERHATSGRVVEVWVMRRNPACADPDGVLLVARDLALELVDPDLKSDRRDELDKLLHLFTNDYGIRKLARPLARPFGEPVFEVLTKFEPREVHEAATFAVAAEVFEQHSRMWHAAGAHVPDARERDVLRADFGRELQYAGLDVRAVSDPKLGVRGIEDVLLVDVHVGTRPITDFNQVVKTHKIMYAFRRTEP